MRDKIIEIVSKSPSGIAMTQICRTMNDRGLPYCKKKECYANPRKRKKWGNRKNACKFNWGSVKYSIHVLEEKGKLIIRREKRADQWQNRKWDFMKMCYLSENAPPEVKEMKI